MQPSLIVIGGSAGALEPLKAILHGLPTQLDAAIVCVLHLPAGQPSSLPAILGRAGPLPTLQAANGAKLEAGHIYIAPPDFHTLIQDGELQLARNPRENRHRPAIDPLFRTAARQYGSRALGIILSGTLDDGAAGLWAIKQAGGEAIVQSPEDASYPSMPQAVIRWVQPEHVLPAQEIAAMMEAWSGQDNTEQSPTRKAQVSTPAPAFPENEGATPASGMELSPFACPDCHGVLWAAREEGPVQYRCRIGHAYTEQNLEMRLDENVEDALWAAVRVLQEHASLSLRLANVSPSMAERYQERAQAYTQHAETIKRMLAESPQSNFNAGEAS